MSITPLPGPLGWVRPMYTVADTRFVLFCEQASASVVLVNLMHRAAS